MTKDQVKALHIGFPRDYIALSRGFNPAKGGHKGIDMCWNAQYGGQNAPVYAPADGTVVAIRDGKGNTWSKGVGDWGNYVKIQHANGVYTLSAHLLKGSILVKRGQKVSRGQMVAKMNNSGYSNGSHVHFEFYLGGSGTAYRVDPLLYCYAYPEDTVNADTQKKYNILHYAPPSPIPQIGQPVERNKAVDQIEVKVSNLRARVEPDTSAEVLGYVNEGIYNVNGTAEADGYTWYMTDEAFWCAKVKDVTYHPAEARYNVTILGVTEADKDALLKTAKSMKADVTVEEV